jgi:uncharacterized lipoprotein
MNLKRKNSLIITIILSTLLAACTNTTNMIIVSPDLVNHAPTNFQYGTKSLQLSVQDLRTTQHVVEITKKDQSAQLLKSQESLNNIVLKNLSEQFIKQGLNINNLATNQLAVTIEKALINVEQSLIQHKFSSQITLRVSLYNGQQRFNKGYQIKGNGKGPLHADIAVLGRDFNQQLSQLLAQLLSDPELRQLIK